MLSHQVMSDCLWLHVLWHTRLPCPPLSPMVCSNSCPLSWWYYLTLSSSMAPISFCLQSFPASVSFPMSQLFTSGAQSIGASTSERVLPMNIQGWFPLGLTCLLSNWPLTVQGAQESSPVPKFESIINSLALSLLYGPTLISVHDYWKNHSFDYMDLCQQSDFSAF